MLTVIIPTIWAYEPHTKYLEQIIGHDCIGEVLIIDNRKENRPDAAVLKHPKVRILEQEKNIYVNPAWNLGVQEAKYDNLCFLSDDVIADSRVYFEADKFLTEKTEPNHGVLVTLIGWELHNQPKVSDGIIQISSYHSLRNDDKPVGMHGAFALFFCHKKQYIEIPEAFKILSGDAYLWNKMLAMGRMHYVMYNFFFHSPFGVSCAIVFNEKDGFPFIKNDIENYDNFVKNGGLEN
jgi:hypothetical protein